MPDEEKVLSKVTKLLDRANHPGTSEHERDACLAKADELMVKFAIDEAMLAASQTPEERRKPVVEVMTAYDPYSIWRPKFQTLIAEIAKTARVRAAAKWNGDVTLVGFQEDVSYVQMLWMTVYYAFTAKLEPKWEPTLSFDHNVYNFKVAGTPWEQIARTANANAEYVPWPDGGKLIRAYKRHCRVIGETPTNHTQRHDAYRESFAEGFVTRIAARLEAMRTSGEAQIKSSGAELVLHRSGEEIDEMFFDLFPNLRPMSPEEAARRREEMLAAQRAAARAHEEMLAAMTPKQRAAYEKRQEAERRKQARADAAYWRRADKEWNRSYDSAGRRAGQVAGDSVDLAPKTGVNTPKRGEIR